MPEVAHTNQVPALRILQVNSDMSFHVKIFHLILSMINGMGTLYGNSGPVIHSGGKKSISITILFGPEAYLFDLRILYYLKALDVCYVDVTVWKFVGNPHCTCFFVV